MHRCHMPLARTAGACAVSVRGASVYGIAKHRVAERGVITKPVRADLR